MNSFKRILVAAPTAIDRTKNGLHLGRALGELGADVRYFDYDRKPWPLRWMPKPMRPKDAAVQHRNYVNESLVMLARRWQPDLFLCIKGVQLEPETIRVIGRLGAVTAGYWIDDPLDHERSLINAGAYDVYFTNDRGSITRYREAGIARVHHLPSAVDLTQFHPLNRPTRHDLSFIGTLSLHREAILAPLCDRDIQVFGPGWRKNSTLPSGCTQAAVFGGGTNRVFNETRVNLNIHNWFGTGSAMNLRLFEVPAAGGFLLTDWVEEIDDYFEEGKDLVCWRDPEELPALIDHYLANPAERARIAANGHARVVAEHSYLQRARNLLEHLR